MAKKFLTDINIAGGVYDSSGDIGSSGQVLSSTGSGVNWINANSAASVVYQDGFTGDGSTTAFTLANSIDNENKTQVYIDGVYQHKDNYSLNGTTLTFSTAPPNSSDIEVISFSTVSSADDILYDIDFGSAGLMTTNGSGVYSITTNNSSNWNTAYTYSQVGHLPLAGGTLTGALGVGSNNINFDDGGRARFGNSSDMQIYHDGSNSIIEEHGDGNLYIRGANQVRLQGSNQSNLLIGNQGGSVGIYHNNSAKIETASYGAQIINLSNTTAVSETADKIKIGTFGSGRPAIFFDTSNTTYTNRTWFIENIGHAGKLRFGRNGKDIMEIFNDGNIYMSDNLGIGTTSPSSLLHIQGSTYNRVQTYFDGSYTSGFKFSDLNGGIWYDAGADDLILNSGHANSQMIFNTGGSESVRIDSSGNVGINTTAPSARLHIDQPSNDRAGGLYIERNGSSYGLAAFVNSGGYGIIGGGGSYANDVISMDFNNTYVGIGDTTPDAKLDVELAATNTYDGTALNTPNIIVSNRNSSNVNSQASIISLRSTGWAGSTTGVVNLAAIQAGNASSAHFAIQTRNGGTYAERMRISSDGRIGFGVDPFAHSLGTSVNIDLKGNGGIWGYAGATYVNSNAYYDSGWKYKSSNPAATLQVGGSDQILTFRQAASGTAGSTITYTEAFRIHTDGKVGVGVSAPTHGLEINGTNFGGDAFSTTRGTSRFYVLNANNSYGVLGMQSNHDLHIRTNATTKMLVTAAGNLAIGTTSSAERVTIAGVGSLYPNIKFTFPGVTSRFMKIGMVSATKYEFHVNGSGTYMTFATEGTERMRIESGGDIVVKKRIISNSSNSSDNGLILYGGTNDAGIIYSFRETGASGSVFRWYTGGTVVGSVSTTASSTSFNTSSDYRLKENVIKMTDALNRVSQLKPSRFNFIIDPNKTVDGFLAHEVQNIVPEAISGEKDAVDEDGNPEYQGIDQSKLVPLLVGAIQELKAEIETLKTQINGSD